MTAWRRLVREERGAFTLVELLTAMGIMIVILSATLLTFNEFEVTNRVSNDRQDSQQQARQELDLLARDLRNLASPTPAQPQAVDKATAYDMVFQTVDSNGPNAGENVANVRRVRYCLDDSNSANGVLWMQWQTWTSETAPDIPSTAGCPDNAWGTVNRRQVTPFVTNRISGQNRPLFSYNSATLTDISSIHADLFMDLTPTTSPNETRLSTGVFLRNQNRKPVAVFETPTAAGNKRIILNGSASSDPEGSPLVYKWYDGADLIGTGITCDCTATATGNRTITLKVYDAAELEGVSSPVAVTVT
jgi:type II secretory pathway pseudopilin PulG